MKKIPSKATAWRAAAAWMALLSTTCSYYRSAEAFCLSSNSRTTTCCTVGGRASTTTTTRLFAMNNHEHDDSSSSSNQSFNDKRFQSSDEASSSSSDKMMTLLNRRSLISKSLAAASTTAVAVLAPMIQPAVAGIDLSSLQPSSSSSNSNSNVIRSQLRELDGSASSRVQQAQELSAASRSSLGGSSAAPPLDTNNDVIPPTVATLAYRYTLSGSRTRNEGVLWTRYQDSLQTTTTTTTSGSGGSIPVEFIYPSDWLPLGRALGTLQYVDQRNGDKVYVLKVQLPDDETLETVDKQFFGRAIMDPRGSLVKNLGNEISDYKVTSSKMLASADQKVTPRRRLKLKYTTVTGNNYSVERRGLVDCYQVDNKNIYMLLTSSNAVKFDAGGRERETVEAMVDSFRVGY